VETPVVKRVRADARRNRERLLVVAEDVFASRGVSASTEDIARAAGVGIGTLFRHFPTKEALLQAVFVARLHQLALQAEQLCSAPDAGAAFETFFRQVIAEAQTKLTLVDALAQAGIDLTLNAGDAKQELNCALEHLLARARGAGAIRADVGLPELLALIVGTTRAVQHVGNDPQVEERTVRVVLDGLAARAKGSEATSGSS
jgi:AcrR family transcriptional regulator